MGRYVTCPRILFPLNDVTAGAIFVRHGARAHGLSRGVGIRREGLPYIWASTHSNDVLKQ
jgi:hypothetical protein